MRKIVFTLLVLALSINNMLAQGIEFQHITLQEALLKADKEGKLVFIDFYTVWCAPCKIMNKNVFPLPEVGTVYNKEFISIKLDAEKEGLEAAKKYGVDSYPTFLFLTPQGKVTLKDTGSMPTESFVSIGQKAVASLTSDFSLEKLKSDFPNKQNDEHFLKIYVEKMIEYGQDPSAGVEAWLKVQTEIKENDVDMMEYLMSKSKYLIVGGKAEEIYYANLDEYMDIATKYEEKVLDRLKLTMAANTREIALDKKSPELLKSYIDAIKKLPEQYTKKISFMDLEITYYALLKDKTNFKLLIEKYVDSLKNDKSIAQIKNEDEAIYNKYKTAYDKEPNPQSESILKAAASGANSTKLIKNLSDKGLRYLSAIESKQEYKTLNSWIDYGYSLQPESYFIDNLKADMYYKEGKTKKAILLKERAVKNWSKDDKRLATREYELEQMKKGESI